MLFGAQKNKGKKKFFNTSRNWRQRVPDNLRKPFPQGCLITRKVANFSRSLSRTIKKNLQVLTLPDDLLLIYAYLTTNLVLLSSSAIFVRQALFLLQIIYMPLYSTVNYQ
jgi:hypothetical protein